MSACPPTQLHFIALQDDLPAKRLRAFRRDAGWPTTPPRPAADSMGRVQWVSAAIAQKQIGIARLELAAPAFCYVADLIISRDWRGRGVGHWLIEQIERYCASLGIQRLLLEASPGTAPFYAALGFQPDQRVPAMLCKNISPLQRKLFLPTLPH
ncbi:GNAT family N-acetyltransferase [Duganella qianjiadongensis]|uniref:GNAT family N-acetyltransferase n=1 Tax=Duganella qianjiadongensis TaxID=2692176 RepID=A0ABW9VGN4_9BURK|nr:GNAT family N-acetyltransferase [Duganella qianjiadongensis]MYM38025.1 GNAT family N-acetyltransferase [Duganella qianjiadongensis]